MAADYQTEKYIADINRFIEMENDPLERAKLMMHLSIIQENKANIEAFKALKYEHNRRITDTEAIIAKHTKTLTQAQAVILFVAFIAGGAGTILYEAADTVYQQVDQLRMQQQVIATKVDTLIEGQKKARK